MIFRHERGTAKQKLNLMYDSDRKVSNTDRVYCTLNFELYLRPFPSFSYGPCNQRLSARLGFCIIFFIKKHVMFFISLQKVVTSVVEMWDWKLVALWQTLARREEDISSSWKMLLKNYRPNLNSKQEIWLCFIVVYI